MRYRIEISKEIMKNMVSKPTQEATRKRVTENNKNDRKSEMNEEHHL